MGNVYMASTTYGGEWRLVTGDYTCGYYQFGITYGHEEGRYCQNSRPLKVSPILALNAQHAAPVLALDGKAIYTPANRILWPARIALRWHMHTIFRPVSPHTLL